MARRCSIVDEGVSLLRLEEGGYVGLADFHLKRCGYAVQGFDPLTFEVLAVLMQINEPWSNDQAWGGNHLLALNRLS